MDSGKGAAVPPSPRQPLNHPLVSPTALVLVIVEKHALVQPGQWDNPAR